MNASQLLAVGGDASVVKTQQNKASLNALPHASLLLETQAPSKPPAHLDKQPTAEHIRGVVARCRELARQYETIPSVVLEREWWRSFYRAGICLRDTLEEYRDRWHLVGMTSKEVEQAYLLLLSVAYFYEPGGVAEAFFKEQGWVWSDDG
jgi:hypothetical protein